MNKLILFYFLLFCVFVNVYSQKVVRTSGSAQIELSADKSRTQVKKEALQLAQIDAIEKAFGRVVIQGNSTYISNINTGEEVESNTVFNMIANTSVKGEMVELIEEKYSDVKGSKTINGQITEVVDIRCDVVIKARELEESKVEFESKALVCSKKNCATTSFVENDNLFVHFNSPRSGYVTIYLDDTKNTYRLLPYKSMPAEYESGFPVSADKDYIFFSQAPEHNYLEFDFEEDTYQLYSETQKDINRMFVIFTKEPINKPRLVENIDQSVLGQAEKDAGYQVAKALTSEDFQRWLNNVRSFNKEDMQVAIIDITIAKR